MTNTCDVNHIHEDKVASAKKILKDHEPSQFLSIFKALSDQTRLEIAFILSHEEELCVCDIAAITNKTIATTSHHLQNMKKNGVVKSSKRGKMMYYSLKSFFVRQMLIDLYLQED